MSDLKQAALDYHAKPRPGKISVELTKPTETARDLSLAYSPGVAEPDRLHMVAGCVRVGHRVDVL